jgi:Spy/CpxP family protein refolding chaperone
MTPTKTAAIAAALTLLAFAAAAPLATADPGSGAGPDAACDPAEILPWALCIVFSTVDEVCYLTPLC